MAEDVESKYINKSFNDEEVLKTAELVLDCFKIESEIRGTNIDAVHEILENKCDLDKNKLKKILKVLRKTGLLSYVTYSGFNLTTGVRTSGVKYYITKNGLLFPTSITLEFKKNNSTQINQDNKKNQQKKSGRHRGATRRGLSFFGPKCDLCGRKTNSTSKVRNTKGRWLDLCKACEKNVNAEVIKLARSSTYYKGR